MSTILKTKIKFPQELLRKKKVLSTTYKTYNSSILVTPFLVRKYILIYNGKTFIPFTITKKKIGSTLYKLFLKNNLYKIS